MRVKINAESQIVRYYQGESFEEIMKNGHKNGVTLDSKSVELVVENELIVIVYGTTENKPVKIEYQLVKDFDLFWTSIYGGAGVGILAALTGLCVFVGVSYVAQYRIVDRTEHMKQIQLNMLFSIHYANNAHVDILAEKKGGGGSMTANKDGESSANKMMVPGGLNTTPKSRGTAMEGGSYLGRHRSISRQDFDRISFTPGPL